MAAAAPWPPPLRFDHAVALDNGGAALETDGPARILSQALSPAAAAEHAAATTRWRALQRSDGKLSALRLTMPPCWPRRGATSNLAPARRAPGAREGARAPPLCSSSADASARDFPPLASRQAAASSALPADPPVHAALEAFDVADDDERPALRGQARGG